VREKSVGPANSAMVLGFRQLPGVLDRAVTSMMRLLGTSHVPAGGAGHVLELGSRGGNNARPLSHLWS
jgi:hypothetical protein